MSEELLTRKTSHRRSSGRPKCYVIDAEWEQLNQNLNWRDISVRLKAYRVVHGYTTEEVAERAHLMITSVEGIEKRSIHNSAKALWAIIAGEHLSIEWLLFGKGKFDDPNDPKLLPKTIQLERGVGVRRDLRRRDAEEGEFTGEPLEFIMAIDHYKRTNGQTFVSWTEAYELLWALGYRKVATPDINPMKGVTQ